MRVAFVVPECDPFAKVGGLADVAGSLPRALRALGHDVAVFLPKYAAIPASLLHGAEDRGEIAVESGELARRGRILETRHGGVPVFLLDEPDLFDRPGIYGERGVDYPDNAARFAFLSLGALLAMERVGFRADAIHAHDWQTALVPVYRRARRLHPGAGVVFTIHNLAYQGVFEKGILAKLGIPWEFFRIDGLEFFDRANLLKGGLVFSTLLTTVSPTYAREIQTPAFGAGLEGVLRERARDLHGILNGIDVEGWNPATDAEIPERYGPDAPAGKRKCKNRLQRELRLGVDRATPLFVAVGRLDPQKGFDLIAELAPYLLDRGAELAVLGAGQESIASRLRAIAHERPDRLSATIGFEAALARRLYAGGDFFLMPSRFEPCGLGQMIAMRYGTLPVVRATGGLADTVVDADADPGAGNGFVFDELSAEALRGAIDRALTAYEKRARFEQLVGRAMRGDFSWERSARTYAGLYEEAHLREARR